MPDGPRDPPGADPPGASPHGARPHGDRHPRPQRGPAHRRRPRCLGAVGPGRRGAPPRGQRHGGRHGRDRAARRRRAGPVPRRDRVPAGAGPGRGRRAADRLRRRHPPPSRPPPSADHRCRLSRRPRLGGAQPASPAPRRRRLRQGRRDRGGGRAPGRDRGRAGLAGIALSIATSCCAGTPGSPPSATIPGRITRRSPARASASTSRPIGAWAGSAIWRMVRTATSSTA